MQKTKQEIFKEIKKHDKHLNKVWITPEGFKLKYYFISDFTGLPNYYNVVIHKPIEFNSCGKDKSLVCNAISFDFQTRNKAIQFKELFDIEAVNVWAKNSSDNLPYKRTIIFAYFKDRVLTSEKIEMNGETIDCDYNFSFWVSSTELETDTETIKEFTL